MKTGLYFLALVAPESIDRQVLTWKILLQERYGCKAALKSPAHVTLIPPFRMEEIKEPALMAALDQLAQKQASCNLQLSGFGHFKPRVIYVRLLPNPPLASLQAATGQHFRELALFPIKNENRDFVPHLTIATRDLPAEQFEEAWSYFSQLSYTNHYTAGSLDLLRLEANHWKIIHQSPLTAPQVN